MIKAHPQPPGESRRGKSHVLKLAGRGRSRHRPAVRVRRLSFLQTPVASLLDRRTLRPQRRENWRLKCLNTCEPRRDYRTVRVTVRLCHVG